MTYEQMIRKFEADYIGMGYADSLDKVLYEERMIKGTPEDCFKFGEDEKEARLCVLWHLEIDIRDKQDLLRGE
jgi:hypothetical protein